MMMNSLSKFLAMRKDDCGAVTALKHMAFFMSINFAVAGGRALARRQQWLCLAVLLCFGLTLSAVAQPANDNFANARLIVGTASSYANNTLLATLEANESAPVHPTAINTVWFRWVAPSSGPVIFTTDHSDTTFDTVLAVYTGNSLTNLALVAGNDNSPNLNQPANLFTTTGLASYLQFTASAGTTYYIALAGRNGETGNYRLFWNMGGYAGTFQFSSSLFEANEREALAPRNTIMDPFTIRGARVTLTRQDGFSGRVKVTYRIADTTTATNGTQFSTTNGIVDNSLIGNARDLFIRGTNAFVTTGGLGNTGLRVLDVSNPRLPLHQATLNIPGATTARMVNRGDYLYIASGAAGLVTVYIKDPKNPYVTNSFPVGGFATDVVLNAAGDKAYLSMDTGLTIVNLSTVPGPTLGLPASVAGSFTSRLPSAPFAFTPANVNIAAGFEEITINGHGYQNNDEVRFTTGVGGALPTGLLPNVSYYVIVVDANRFRVSLTPQIDAVTVATPVDLLTAGTAPMNVQRYVSLSPLGSGLGVALNAAETHAILADGAGGTVLLDVTVPATPTLAGRIRTVSFAAGVKTLNTTAYVADGTSGLRFINITTPTAPALLPTSATLAAATNVNLNAAGTLGAISTATGITSFNPAVPGSGGTSVAMVTGSQAVSFGVPYSFAASGTGGLRVLNSTVAAPTSVRSTYPFSVYSSVTNSVIFDDWQTSASFLVNPIQTTNTANAILDLDIVDVRLMTGESPNLLAPKKSVTRGSSQLVIYDVTFGANFEHTHLRVAESAGDARVSVLRQTGGGVANDSVTSWQINGDRVSPADQASPSNNIFPLDAGADYATPGEDFQAVSGTISWPAGRNENVLVIPITDDSFVEFNETFRVDLFLVTGQTGIPGASDFCYVTIVTDEQIGAEQAAGAVDPSYNRDYFNLTSPPFNPTPGANDQVHAVAINNNQQAIIGGDFTAVNSDASHVRLTRFTTNGDPDPNFQVGTGPNASVLAIQTTSNQVYIAGKFSSYNSQQAKGIARLTANGTLDGTFNAGVGVANPSSTPIRAIAIHTNGQHSGKIVAVGDFTTFAGQSRNRIVRLTSNGSLDGEFDAGTGANGPIYAVKIIHGSGALGLDGYIMIAGNFTTYNGVTVNRLARLLPGGGLDTTFNPGSGANNTVYGLDVRTNGVVLIGGDFTTYDLLARPRVAQVNANGSLDQSFEVGVGFDDTVYTAVYDSAARPVLGGLFRNYNFTRRAGFARLLSTGHLDTSFADVAYNHFAGLPMRYSILAEGKPFVRAMALQTNGDIIIGGSFQRVGGGNRNTDPRLINTPTLASPWRDGQDQPIATPYWQNRDDMRNRSNIARLKGGATPGPGNISFSFTQYQVDESASLLFVTLTRDNTDPDGDALGDVRADFVTKHAVQVTGTAANVLDYGTPANITPRWISRWNNSQMVSQSRSGPNNQVLGLSRVELPIVNDGLIEGDETFAVALNNPRSNLMLGGSAAAGEGEVIPLGIALGRASATVTIIDDDFEPSFISFSKPRYSVSENETFATIEVVRTGSTTRSVSVDYLTTEHLGASMTPPPIDPDGAASQASDFSGVSGRLTFDPGQTSVTFTVPISDDVVAEGDETLNLYLFNHSAGTSFATATQTVASVDAGTDTLSLPGHGLYNETELTISSSVALPAGLVAGTKYYVRVIDSSTIQLTLAPYDTPVDIADTGSGVITIAAVQNLSRLAIYDNDFSNGTLRFSTSGKYTVNEGATTTVTVERTGGNVGAIEVTYETIDGTATQGSSDYVYKTGKLSWGNLDGAPKSFTVAANTDGSVEGVEFFTIQLSGARRLSDGGPVNVAAATIPVEIVNADKAGLLGFAVSNFSVSENGGKATITVKRTGGSSETVMAQVVDDATGSAATPTHYSFASPVNLTLGPGVTSASFTIDIVDDTGTPVQNANRTVNLRLTGFVNAENVADETATLTIVDNETINEPAGSVDTTYNSLAGPDNFIHALMLQADEKLVIGGDFNKVNGITRTRLARLDKSGQIDNSFLVGAGANDSVRAVVQQEDGRILIGGLFTNYDGSNRRRIARLNVNGTLDLTFDPGSGADNPVHTIAVHRDAVYYGKVLVAGEFSTIGGVVRPYVARLDTNGVVDANFNVGSGPNGPVYAMVIQPDGKVIIGGDFTSVNSNTNYPYLARLNVDGSVDTTFSSANKLDGTVRALVLQSDGKIVAGGNFVKAGASSRPFIVRLNADGILDATFNPGVGGSHPVLALAIQPDGKILAGGDFLKFNGVSRSRITRLNTDGSPDPTINFGSGANSFVSSIVVQPSDERIILGGGFTQFGDVARNYLVRLYGGVVAGPGRVQFNLAQFTVSETETNAVIVVRRTGGTTGDVTVQMSTADILPAGTGFATSADYTPVNLANLSFPNAETFQEVRITINNDTLVEGDELLDLSLSSPAGQPNFGLGDQPIAQLRIADNDSLIAFKQALFSVNENDPSGVVQLQVVRSGGLNGSVVVRVSTTNGTATAGNDFTNVSTVLTFQVGETNKTVTVPLVNDGIDEGNESFTAILTLVSGDGELQNPPSTTITILNDDFAPGTVQFSQTLFTVDENAGTVTLAVIRTNGSSGLVTVNYSTATVGDAVGGVGVAAGVDFIHTNGALAFADGERLKFITVPILPDTDSTETNELFQVNLSAPTGGASLGFPNPTTVSIANNNSAIYGKFTIVADPTVNENGAALLVSITLSDRTAPFDEVKVDYDTVGLTAVAGLDFVRAQGTLTFNNGMASETQTFTVNLIDDPLVEDNEDFNIVLSNPFPVGGPALPAPATKTVSIISEDSLPGTIVFAQPQFQASETAGTMQIVLSRTNGHTGAVSVDVNLSDLQAKGTVAPAAGFDYLTGTVTVNWADGDRADKIIPVTLINDTYVEADEGFLVTLSNIINASFAQDGGGVDITTALAVILDDELKAGSIDSALATRVNGPILGLALRPAATQGQLTVAGDFTAVEGLNRSNVAQISFDGSLYTGFDVGSLTLGGTSAVVRTVAVYTNGNNIGKVLIAGRFDSVAGVSRTNIARVNPDGTVDQTFNPGLGANAPINALVIQADGNIVIGGDFNQYDTLTRNFVARIKNDGTADATFDPLGGGNGPVNALALQSDGVILVGGDFTQFNGISSPRLARLAANGTMDTAFSTALGTGFDNAVFAVTVQSDSSGERILVGGAFTNFNGMSAARFTRLNLTGTTDTAGVSNFGTGFNDSVFAIAVQSDKKILVGGNFTSFQGVPQNRIVRLDATGALDTTVNFGAGANSFISSIVQQPDGRLVVAGGFTTFDDQAYPYLVRLNNGTNLGVGVLQFSASDFQVYENGGSVTVEVKRILGTRDSLSVDVEFIDGSALQGVNYLVPAVTNVTFAEGETIKTLLVNIPDDPGGIALNANRTFTVRLTNAVNNDTLETADLISSQDEATVTIIDNETVIEFASASFVVAENGLNAQVVINRSGGSNDPVNITFETITTGTATELADYLGVTNNVIWSANDMTPKTVLIPINEDNFVEGIETVNLQLSGFAGYVLPGTVTNSVLSLLDNDFSSGVISFESAAYNVIEGLPAQIVVVRTNGSSGIVSALLTVSNSTALAGADFLGTNILVTFANGESRKVVAINTKDDTIQDDGEIFLVHLSGFTGGAAAGLSDAAVTIDDNDVTIGFELGSTTVAESDTTLQLNVTRSGLLTRTFIVDYATANVTAQAGLDYVQTNGVIVFGPDETNKVITLQIKDDFVIEGPETFTVNVSGANLSLLGLNQAAITIGDNDLATDLEVQVAVNNPINVGELVRYSLLVTNYGPSDISGVTLTNILPASLTLQTVSTPNVTVNGSTLIFDLPVLAKNAGYTVDIEALDTLGTVRTVQNITTIGLPAATNDVNLANNSVTNVTTIAGPRPYPAVAALALTSEVPGPANGAFDINEQVTVNVTFRNIGETSTSAAVASLAATGGVVLHAGPQTASLGALAPNAAVSRSFTFTATGTNGGTLSLTFNLTDSGSVTYDPAVLNYRLGGSTSTTRTNQITINSQGDATPYPDVLLVSGLVGIVDTVSLTLSNVSHSYPDDIDMVLVSPAGQAVLVMSDAGGDKILNNVTFTISDQASIDLPDNAQIVNGGSYRPRDYSVPGVGDDAFSAPPAPYFTSMSAFRGIDPNGQWSLYVRDDTTGDFGAISNGWSLNIATVFPANPTAGLTVNGTQTAGPLLVGADQVYTIVVTNRGPASASSVFLTNVFSAPFTVVSAVNSVSGAATFPSGRVVLSQGTMANGAAVTNVITVRPTAAGSFTNLVTAANTGGETDSFLGDNTLVFMQVIGASADLAVGVTTSPSGTVALGNNLTYNINLTNLGPSTATSVVLTNVLPSGVNYVSSSASQGVVSRSGSLVTANLGSLAANGTVQLTVIVTPTAAGSLTNSVTAASAIADSNPANNQAVATTTVVTDSADLQLALSGSPDPVTLGGNITYTISVTNRGPSTATGVTITNPLPSSVTLVSFATPYGTAANTAGAVVFTLGSVPTGTNVTMQVVVTANSVGAVNNTAFVTANGTFDPVSANNAATIATAVQNPSADIDLGAATLLAESASPANGAIDPGESVTVSLELVNKGAAATANLVATLLPTGGVATNSGPQVLTYGAIASGAAVSRNFTFTANGNLGDTLSVTLQLQDGASNLGTVTFTFQLGETERVNNTATIAGVNVGPALTYPSIINVSGVSGTTLKATVTLSNVTHTFPDDFDILLVGPTGKKVLLVSDVGGGFAISGVNITLDDSASTSLPDSGAIADGVYKPSNYLNAPTDSSSTNDVFDAPAPAGPYATTLAELVGTNPNGQWSLYVMDDQTGNIGSIGGWSLSLVTVATLAPSADMVVTVAAAPVSVPARSNLTYTVTVTNRGPNAVSGVTVSNAIPAGATLQSLATLQGTIGTNSNGAIIWSVGSVAANAQYQAVIVLAPQTPGSLTNVTVVTQSDIELNSSNNTATTITTVTGFVLAGGSINVSSGNVALTLIGEPGVTYVVESSTDLVNWVDVSTQSSADGIIVINDPAGTGSGLRFYRARQQ
jgi:uncharacterized repeat protein (TIGR01451 family)/uncharacterized delta-60 repeat protein